MKQLKRRDDWKARFAAEIDSTRHNKFEWGGFDCFLGLICGSVKAITGKDIGHTVRGRYHSEREGIEMLKGDGFKSLSAFMASVLPEIHPSQADVGDVGVVVAPGDLGEALCVIDSSSVIVLTEEGHGRRPRSDVIRAYKVGEK